MKINGLVAVGVGVAVVGVLAWLYVVAPVLAQLEVIVNF